MLIGLCSVPASKACVVDCNKYRKRKTKSHEISRDAQMKISVFAASFTRKILNFSPTHVLPLNARFFRQRREIYEQTHFPPTLWKRTQNFGKKTLNNKCQRAFQCFMNISPRCVLSARMELRLAFFNMSLHNGGIARLRKAPKVWLWFGEGAESLSCVLRSSRRPHFVM